MLIVIALISGGTAVLVRSGAAPGAPTSASTRRGEAAVRRPDGGVPDTRPPSSPSRTVEPLDARLVAAGYELPPHALVYGARVDRGPAGLSYREYEAGDGALGDDFWPASSIKVLAALGALDFARSLGFDGGARVVLDVDEEARTLRSIYESAIRDSSNEDYDLLVQIAGIDRLNSQFLVPARGFPVTSITRSYAGADPETSPAMILDQGDHRTYVPERHAELDPECDAGNCSNLFEMTESVRRVVLNDEIPAAERFDIDPADLAGLTQALLEAEGFFPQAVADTVGADARIYAKPGDAEDRDCLDVALIESLDRRRYLLAASVPHSEGGCEVLAEVATQVLRLIAS